MGPGTGRGALRSPAPTGTALTHWHCAHLHRTCVLCKCGGRAAPVQVCTALTCAAPAVLCRCGVRAACTVPHTVPVSYREANVCKCGGRAHRPDPAPTCTAPPGTARQGRCAVRCRPSRPVGPGLRGPNGVQVCGLGTQSRARRAGVSFGRARGPNGVQVALRDAREGGQGAVPRTCGSGQVSGGLRGPNGVGPVC